MINLVYLNGSYHAADSANISVLDRGFLFGDGVYEVIPVYNGMLFRLPEHLARLKASLEAIDIPNPHADNEWAGIFAQLVDNNCTRGDAVLYVQVTRGVMEKRNHAYTRDMHKNRLAITQRERIETALIVPPARCRFRYPARQNAACCAHRT